MFRRAGLGLLNVLLVICCSASAVAAEDYAIDETESLFAVVTHKGGLLSAFAHNHLVHAGAYDAELSMDAENLGTITFSLDVPVTDLVADDLDMKERWFPRLEAAGILEDPFEDIKESNREEIREAMLSDEQLGAETYPAITAKVIEVADRDRGSDEDGFTHDVTVAITVHGETVRRAVPATIELDGRALLVEAYAPFRFTDFGIEPYKAAFGAIKNRDEFHIYVWLRAMRAKGE